MTSTRRRRLSNPSGTYTTGSLVATYGPGSSPTNPTCATTFPATTTRNVPAVTALRQKHSDISDVIGGRDVYGNLPQREVTHEKWEIQFHKLNFQPAIASCNRFTTYTGLVYCGATARSLALGFRPPTSEWSVFRDKAYNTFVTQFPTEVSIANFMWELREISSLIPKIRHDSFSKSIANGYLTYEFGWKPMLDDIKKLYSLMEKVQSRIDYLKSRWGKVTRLGLSQESTYSGPSTKKQTVTLDTGSGVALEYLATAWNTRYTAGGKLLHRLDWLFDADKTWRALVGSLGLDKPGSIIWEAIPYSFLFDWFTDLDDLIARLPNITEQPDDWVIKQLSNSRKTKVVVEVRQVNSRQSNSQSNFAPVLLATAVFEWYERVPGLSISLDRLSLLSPKQLALLAALATGRS